MSRDDRERLRDARNHLFHAIVTARDYGTATFATRVLRQSFIFDLLIAAEALGAVSGEVKGLGRNIPWQLVRGMRNRLIHEYWHVDPSTLERIAANELHELVDQVDDLLIELDATGS